MGVRGQKNKLNTVLLTEKEIQYKIYHTLYYLLNKSGKYLPNIQLYNWETDLLYITNDNYVYEFEIKRTLADYKADFKKKNKHILLSKSGLNVYKNAIPNYFWYVIQGFDLTKEDVPEYSGLMIIKNGGIDVIKKAPILHKNKVSDKQIAILNYRMYFKYWNLHKEVYDKKD